MSGFMRSDLDRRLQGYFEATTAEALPEGLLDDVYAVTRRTVQRRGRLARWTIGLRLWSPAPSGAAASARTIVLAALLLLALAAALVIVAGSHRRLPPPFGLADNGLVMYDLNQQLYVPQDDGTSKRLPIGLSHSWAPTFSPDGTKLAFFSQAEPGNPIALYVADADGGRARPVSGDVPPAGGFSVSWSPDSTRIVYESTKNAIHNALYVAAADGSGVTRLSPADDADRTGPVWSPLGDLIAYRLMPSNMDHLELEVISPDGRGERWLAQAQVSTGAFLGSQWAPDGTKIAYFRKQTNGDDVVETVDLEGRVQRVSGFDEDAYNPVWSNDGLRIAYGMRTNETKIVNLTTRAHTILPDTVGGCGVAWSPDDQFMVGLGTNCALVLRFPVEDPGAATRLSGSDGAVAGVTWQRR